MRYSVRWILILGVLAAVMSVGSISAEPKNDEPKKADEVKKAEPKTKSPNYYPVEVGNTWKFKVTANGNESTVTTTIAKHETIDGLKLARLESVEFPVTEHLIQTDKGVFRHRMGGGDITPPFKLLPYPAKVGLKWTGSFTAMKMKADYTGEIQAEEMVEVAAGKFKALKVHVQVTQNGQDITTVYWFVKDIGFVKQTLTVGDNINVQLELEKFTPKKAAEKEAK